MIKCPHARGRSWAPSAPASDPCATLARPSRGRRCAVGAPWPSLGSIFSIFGRPEADQKINDFSTPSKIAPRGQKVDPMAPKGRFFMDFEVILGSFFHVFFRFFENVKNYEIALWWPPQLDYQESAPSKSLIFQRIFYQMFMFFLEPLLELLFLDFMLIFCEKVRFWEPFATQLGSKMDPWGDHFDPKIDF